MYVQQCIHVWRYAVNIRLTLIQCVRFGVIGVSSSIITLIKLGKVNHTLANQCAIHTKLHMSRDGSIRVTQLRRSFAA